METTTIMVQYENPDTKEEFYQNIVVDQETADDVYMQMMTFNGGDIPVNTPLFYLLTAIKYVSKLQGFSKTPNFKVVPPDNFVEYEKRKLAQN